VFYRAKEKLRMMGDTGGGRALSLLINALYCGDRLRFSDLLLLDAGNRGLALELIKEFLDESRSFEEWESVVVAAMNCCDSEPSGEAEVELEFQLLPKAVLEQAGQVRLFP
jgi:hypothetical protein